jgi:hypothetical protein
MVYHLKGVLKKPYRPARRETNCKKRDVLHFFSLLRPTPVDDPCFPVFCGLKKNADKENAARYSA